MMVFNWQLEAKINNTDLYLYCIFKTFCYKVTQVNYWRQVRKQGIAAQGQHY